MFDESLVSEWVLDRPIEEFEPLGDLKLLKLIYFLVMNEFKLNDKRANAQEFYDVLSIERGLASQQYVLYKKIIDGLFNYNVYASELYRDLGINLKAEAKEKKPKKPKAKKATKKTKLPSNVVNFEDYKKKSA